MDLKKIFKGDQVLFRAKPLDKAEAKLARKAIEHVTNEPPSNNGDRVEAGRRMSAEQTAFAIKGMIELGTGPATAAGEQMPAFTPAFSPADLRVVEHFAHQNPAVAPRSD